MNSALWDSQAGQFAQFARTVTHSSASTWIPSSQVTKQQDGMFSLETQPSSLSQAGWPRITKTTDQGAHVCSLPRSRWDTAWVVHISAFLHPHLQQVRSVSVSYTSSDTRSLQNQPLTPPLPLHRSESIFLITARFIQFTGKNQKTNKTPRRTRNWAWTKGSHAPKRVYLTKKCLSPKAKWAEPQRQLRNLAHKNSEKSKDLDN